MTSTEPEINNADVACVPVVATGPSLVNTYLEKYRKFGKQSVEACLAICRTLVEAKEELTAEEFTTFCKAVELEEGGSTFSKYKKIGEAYLRLSAYVDRLPHAWTSLYALAKLPAERFEEISERLHRHMTAEEIAQLVVLSAKRKPSGKPAQSTPAVEPKYVISIADVNPVHMDDLVRDLQEMAKKYGFTVEGLPADIAADSELLKMAA